MKYIERVMTYDGVLHISQNPAKQHLERKYANIICPLAHRLNNLKFSELSEYIDKNLDTFAELIRIKNDMKMEDDDEN